MNASQRTTRVPDRRIVLSALWIFAMFNYLYADVYTLFFNQLFAPEAWKQLQAGQVGGVQLTQGFVLITAALMETAIAMVLLSWVLSYRANRWANIFAGAFHTAFVAWSLFGEAPTLFYAFFSAVEIGCTLFVVWYAWTWRSPEINLNSTRLARGESGRGSR